MLPEFRFIRVADHDRRPHDFAAFNGHYARAVSIADARRKLPRPPKGLHYALDTRRVPWKEGSEEAVVECPNHACRDGWDRATELDCDEPACPSGGGR